MKNKRYFALFIMLVITGIVVGQGAAPAPSEPPVPFPPGLSIDGGLIFLIVSGVLYGVKKKIKN